MLKSYSKFVATSSLIGALTLSGCGMISAPITSDETLLDKAETATGISKENLSLVPNSKESSLDAVNFKVKDKQDNLYKCYFTTIIATTSDAICSRISKDGKVENANQGNCNALLRAAGKCK